MRRDVRAYLAEVVEASDLIGQFIADQGVEAYRSDPMLQSAVERQLGIVGRSLDRLARTDPALAARIPDIGTISGLRDDLAHGYDVVRDEVVWEASTVDLPGLAAEASALLAELEG
jgi:uncharacterized protein with HEPN domain